MARKPIEQQIAQLEARAKTLKARLAKQDRARDTRRKILIGALVLHRLEQTGDGEFSKRLADWLRRELPGFLTRDQDKDLFNDLLDAKAAAPSPMATTELAKPET
ncbi:mobilization protein [Acidiphilium iwatense]|uniref:Mobilization protein n=1 Tax=Acidiphilium iwatense TaxID=768198 RepID=A0ABS9E2N5_9PROT|nr:mobilization protein [Acidiphilium iwatense]MCF3948603.1 mobilization protein [Acidiphilium iwatense]